ncbi:MAG: hypothetical protein K6G57_03345 [Lachnospiraceae bacterium]|nr:hypothetical protein [Lachnospiraceae bacterium]
MKESGNKVIAFIYCVPILAFSYLAAGGIARAFGKPQIYGMIGCLVLLALFVFTTFLISRGANRTKAFYAKVFGKGFSVPVVTGLMIIAGTAFRAFLYKSDGFVQGKLAEAALVSGDPRDMGGLGMCKRIYVALLHPLFFTFGNRGDVQFSYQAILLVITVILCAYGAYRLSGPAASITVTAFWMFSELGAQCCLEEKDCLIMMIFGGAFLCAVPIMGVRDQKPVPFAIRTVISIAIFAAFAYFAYMGEIWEIDYEDLFNILKPRAGILVITFLLLMSVPTAFVRRVKPGGLLNVFMPMPALALVAYAVYYRQEYSIWGLMSILAFFAGRSIDELLGRDLDEISYEKVKNKRHGEINTALLSDADEALEKEKAEKDKAEKDREEAQKVSVVIDGEQKEVELLKNPLPLPKKKAVRKEMDYDYEVADDDDYDIKF